MKLLLCVIVLISHVSASAYYSRVTHAQRDKSIEVTMSFDVGAKAKVDIMFIIDDSGSMSTHQQNLNKNMQGIVQTLNAYSDINASVITTTLKSNTSVSVGEDGKFVGPVLNSQDKNFIPLLSQQVNVGVNGDAYEKPLEATFMALSEPLLSGHNMGFLRPTADLILFYLTDTYEQGKILPQDLFNHLKGLKPNNTLLAMAALSADNKSCPNEIGNNPPKDYNTYIADFVQLTGGQVFDLCGDYTKSMDGLMDQAQVAMSEIVLNNFPQTKIDAKTIVVKVDGVPLAAGDILNGWIYNPTTQTVTLGVNAIGPKNHTLVVTYNVINI